MMSLGRVAVSLGIFSASGAHASIAMGICNSAIASTAAQTAAAPLMSDFIASIPCAGLRANPPVSNVMPLPTYARRLTFFFVGWYEMWRSRGGFAEPWPTPMIPP